MHPCSLSSIQGVLQARGAILCLALWGLLAAWATPAQATGHALIMWIGDYADPSAKLKGVAHDAELAKAMARRLGADHILELKNRQLTFEGMRNALAELASRVKAGDFVFIYFSGHGGQSAKFQAGGAPSGCKEGLATYDNVVYYDAQLRDQLDAMASRASKVVMFNDSCFSGGAVTKSIHAPWPEGAEIKAYPDTLNDPLDDDAAQAKGGGIEGGAVATGACGLAANISKNLGATSRGMAAQTHEVFYMAASAANEAAFGTAEGSVATQAWAACMVGKGSITGEALAACAQKWIKQNTPQFKQTITPQLNKGIVLQLHGGP